MYLDTLFTQESLNEGHGSTTPDEVAHKPRRPTIKFADLPECDSPKTADHQSFLGERSITLDSGVDTLVGSGCGGWDATDSSRDTYRTCRSTLDYQSGNEEVDGDNIAPTTDDQAAADYEALQSAKRLLARSILRGGRINDYQLQRLLGFGTFGIVLKASSPSGVSVAMKIMRKEQIHDTRMCADPQSSDTIPLEVALLKYAPYSRNIIRYVDSWSDSESWYLVTEFGGHGWNTEPVDRVSGLPVSVVNASSYLPYMCGLPSRAYTAANPVDVERVVIQSSCGSVCHTVDFPVASNDHSLAGLLRACGGYTMNAGKVVRTGRPVLPDNIQKRVFRQVVEAVRDLHANGIAHKDLKDENILVDSQFNVKLIDFGHAAFYRSAQLNPNIRLFSAYGTPLFAAPEIRSGMKFVGPEADVYALGLILYEMNSGDLPVNLEEARYCPGGNCVFEIGFGTGFFTEEVRHLCEWMLCPDPANRPTIDQVLRHGWFC